MNEFEIFPDKIKEPSFYELLDTYPTALPTIKRYIKQELNDLKLDMELLRVQHQSGDEVMQGYCEALMELKQEKVKTLSGYLYYITPHETVHGSISSHDIVRAKQRPIKDFIKVNWAGKALCLFHNDKHASMHIYPNNYHCFSCHTSGTVIDIIMKLRNCTFKEAVLFLNGKK